MVNTQASRVVVKYAFKIRVHQFLYMEIIILSLYGNSEMTIDVAILDKDYLILIEYGKLPFRISIPHMVFACFIVK